MMMVQRVQGTTADTIVHADILKDAQEGNRVAQSTA